MVLALLGLAHGLPSSVKSSGAVQLASAPEECTSYTSLAGDETSTKWCQTNCLAGFCPADQCKCSTGIAEEPQTTAPAGSQAVTAAVPKETTATKESGAAKTAPNEKPQKSPNLATALPRKIPAKISGPWFYCADGLDREASGRMRNPQYGDFTKAGSAIGLGNVTGRKIPSWLASSRHSGNAVTLAFMNPLDLSLPNHGVPSAFAEYTSLMRQGAENRDRQIFFAIGGMEFNTFDFLADNAASETAGANACEVAKAYNVGIEIDHEGTKGNDVEGLQSFVKGFRKSCPMGKYPLSMDIMGGPGGGGLFWAPEAVKLLVPAGSPSDPPPDGDFLDFVNLMVIGACQSGECLSGFWKQWGDAGLNYERAAFTFAGDAICKDANSDMVREAWAWGKEQGGYGLRAWSVTPVIGGGEWDHDCDTMGAPGLQLMCSAVGAGCDAPTA